MIGWVASRHMKPEDTANLVAAISRNCAARPHNLPTATTTSNDHRGSGFSRAQRGQFEFSTAVDNGPSPNRAAGRSGGATAAPARKAAELRRWARVIDSNPGFGTAI